jgi:hypothetical protein
MPLIRCAKCPWAAASTGLPDPVARRILAEKVVPSPVLRRPDWPLDEATAAVRTDVCQYRVYTRRAKRALVAANARVDGVRGQRFGAMLTAWPQFQHAGTLLSGRSRRFGSCLIFRACALRRAQLLGNPKAAHYQLVDLQSPHSGVPDGDASDRQSPDSEGAQGDGTQRDRPQRGRARRNRGKGAGTHPFHLALMQPVPHS